MNIDSFQVLWTAFRKANENLKMSFLPGNITFFNFVFELRILKHYYHYEHGDTNNQKCLNTWYGSHRLLKAYHMPHTICHISNVTILAWT